MYLDGPDARKASDRGTRLVPQMRMMIQALMVSPVRNTLFSLGGAITIATLVSAVVLMYAVKATGTLRTYIYGQTSKSFCYGIKRSYTAIGKA